MGWKLDGEGLSVSDGLFLLFINALVSVASHRIKLVLSATIFMIFSIGLFREL